MTAEVEPASEALLRRNATAAIWDATSAGRSFASCAVTMPSRPTWVTGWTTFASHSDSGSTRTHCEASPKHSAAAAVGRRG